SVVIGNTAPLWPDITFVGTIILNRNVLGDLRGVPFTGSANLPFGIDPQLSPLANNGGATPTRLPLPGSPLRERGSNPTGLANDQRGAGYPRILGSAADIGAVESLDAIGTPIAMGTELPDVAVPGSYAHQFKITYFDDTAIAVGSLGDDDVRVIGPNGFDMPA